MRGQWIGRYSDKGFIILNIDETETNYSGVAYILPGSPNNYHFAVPITTDDKSKFFRSKVDIIPIDLQTYDITTIQEYKRKYPEIVHAETADISLKISNRIFAINIETDTGTTIRTKLKIKKPPTHSIINAETMNWNDFKEKISKLNQRKHVFRGQMEPWPLKTSFHRKERYDLYSFLLNDIPNLHRHLCSRTKHVFNLNNPDENGAFLNLIQHHGYPTPLLDWTYSPYVAAFFAFRSIPKGCVSENNVRIFIFEFERWKTDYIQINKLTSPFPHASMLEFLSIDNERMIPQQAMTMLTNIENLEEYITSMGEQKQINYISAIDIPAKQRDHAMKELALMGITAGSLFPGLDGACEELRERFFG